MREAIAAMVVGSVMNMSEYRYNSLRTIVSRLNQCEVGEWSVTTSVKTGSVFVVRII